MADSLAQYRKKPLPEAMVKPKDSEEYVAYAGKDRVERLRIRRALAPTRAPRYLHLQDMSYDGDYGTNFVLVYDFMLVLVRGKNLQALISALESSAVDFIQEFHPDLWEKPADDAPFIESIEIVMPENSPMGDEPEDGNRKRH